MKKAGSKEAFRKVDFTYAYEFAKVAEETGARQFNLISSMGAKSSSLFYYNRVKGEVEEAISSLDIPNINIFRPALLLGDRSEKRLGEDLGARISKFVEPIMIGNLSKYKPIPAKVVAKAMLKISKSGLTGTHIFESHEIFKDGN